VRVSGGLDGRDFRVYSGTSGIMVVIEENTGSMVRFLGYIDPGTGSFALQAAVGTVMGVTFAVRNHLKTFVGKFRKGTQASKPDEE
jgi:hypothetical protein